MSLKPYEQTARIMELLRDIPDEVEKHFCSTSPDCMKQGGCFIKPDGTRDRSNCALFSASVEENNKEIEKRYKTNLLLGRFNE